MARTKMKTRAQKRGTKTITKKNTAKPTVKKTKMTKSANTGASSIKKMEKDLMQVPAKIAAQLNKDLASLKQKESKLKATAIKNTQQVKKSEARLSATEAKSHTAAGKKLFKATQKKHAVIAKTQQGLNTQIASLAQTISTTQDQQAKFKALAKQMTQFVKEWTNTAKTKAAAATTKAKSKKRKQKDVEIPNNIATIERSQADDVQTLFDEISLDESTETAVG